MNDDAIDEDDQALQKGRFYVPQVECHSRYWSNISVGKKLKSVVGDFWHNPPPGAKLGLCRSIIFSKLIKKFNFF